MGRAHTGGGAGGRAGGRRARQGRGSVAVAERDRGTHHGRRGDRLGARLLARLKRRRLLYSIRIHVHGLGALRRRGAPRRNGYLGCILHGPHCGKEGPPRST